ncbi:ZIP metal ion transporter family [Wolffia australiana]
MMGLRWGIFFIFLVHAILYTSASDPSRKDVHRRVQTAPDRHLENTVMDGRVTEGGFGEQQEVKFHGFDQRNKRVPASTVGLFTLAMAAATGLGALPFFFVELEPQWAGICNGLAAGVMLAASFDLVQEGQSSSAGSWVVVGILSGGIFIWLCKKYLEQYGEISMLDIKGADASKVVLVVGIMTLHSFGEGSGVGVSFAGPKGLSQGLLVTLAIAIHNIPEGLAVSMLLASKGVSPGKAMIWSFITSLPQPIVAVPAFLCADAFNKFLPFCTGFAAGCMIWMVVAEVLPDAFKEASPSQVASSATLAVAFMEALSTVLGSLSHGSSGENASGFMVSLLFGLGPLLGGSILVSWALAFSSRQAFLSGISAGAALVLATWRPLQLLAAGKMWAPTALVLLVAGAAAFRAATVSLLQKRPAATPADGLSTAAGLSLSAVTVQSLLACAAVFVHALAEGLALGVAAPRAHGHGRHMVLPVSLHGLPRGAAVASCLLGAIASWQVALGGAAVTGLAGPMAAAGAIMAGMDNYHGLDHVMVFACGLLLPGFAGVFRRAGRLDRASSLYGLVLGLALAGACLSSTRMVCLHTPYCNSAPEAVR